MWFKNLYVFELLEPWNITEENLNGMLEHNKFQKCAAASQSSVGWVSPLGRKSEMLSYHVNGYVMVCLRGEEKQVPSSLVNDELAQKVEMIEEAEGRRVSKRERHILKSDIYDDLLSRALVKSWQLHAYVDIKSNCLIINTSSAKKAELLTIMLRKALGSLKVALPGLAGTDMSELASPVEVLLTKWLKTNNYPKDLVIGQKCVLQSVDDKAGVIRCQNQDLFRSEIKQFIEHDTFVSALTLTWEEKITFSITKEYIFKGLKYLEFVQDQVNDIHTESDMEKFDADFSVMSLLLTEFLARMKSIFSAQGTVADAVVKESGLVV
jgi:recombination associated protein RdgC